MPKRLLISRHRRVLIIVVHLLPLPGSPRWGGNLKKVIRWALDDAQASEDGGADAVIIENFGDAPFCKCEVPAETVAAMAVVGAAVRQAVKVPIGFNVLRNDGHAALALCASCGGDFIRLNILSGAMVTDQGIIEGSACAVTRLRSQLAPSAKILADVHVKHAWPLANVPLEIAARDTIERGLADALIVSGTGTGQATSLAEVKRVRSACPQASVLIGSGATAAEVASYLQFADGLIVGTWVKRAGKLSNPVDRHRVAALRKAIG
jgi:membrane complex biogenesis BtpA family protein